MHCCLESVRTLRIIFGNRKCCVFIFVLNCVSVSAPTIPVPHPTSAPVPHSASPNRVSVPAATTNVTNPTSGILLFGVGGHDRKKKVKNDTITITTIATADDQVMTNTVISISISSPKQKRLSSMLSTHLTSTMTKTSGTKHAYTGRPPS